VPRHITRTRSFLSLAASLSVLLAACAPDTPATAPDGAAALSRSSADKIFTLRIPTMKDGDPFNATFACPAEAGAAIAGKNISPQLQWSNAPEGTEEFAVLLDDPDAPDDNGVLSTFTHWMTWGIDDDAKGLKQAQNGPFVGNNDLAPYGFPPSLSQNYFGACAPPGTGVHRYIFHVFALRTKLGLRTGANRSQFDAALVGKVLKEARITTYVNSGLP
jgi:Raf kinase inhibitor-like YbhB/YbcL family protein